jgi:hypothetical protein
LNSSAERVEWPTVQTVKVFSDVISLFFAIDGIHSLLRPMSDGYTTAAHCLESGLVRLVPQGTSALSKLRAENSLTNSNSDAA